MIHIVREPKPDFVFRAHWITADFANAKVNLTFRCRKRFRVAAPTGTELLRIAADSMASFRLNGTPAAFDPVRGSCALQYFNTYAVGPFLHRGENEIEVIIHSPVTENFTDAAILPALRLEIPGILESASDWEVCTESEWINGELPFFTMQTGYMEFCDFRRSAAYEDGMRTATHPDLLAKRLTPRDIPALRQQEIIPSAILACDALPTAVPPVETLAAALNQEERDPAPERLQDGNALCTGIGGAVLHPDSSGRGLGLILDFGRDYIGRPSLEIDAPDGTVLDMVWGEELWKGRVRADFGNDMYFFTDRYILREGGNTIGEFPRERGGKLVQLLFRNFSRPITLRHVTLKARCYPYERRGSFFSSDPLLNRIQNLCEATLDACTTDTFMDCPWRERAFWVNDLLVENAVSLALFGSSEIHRHAFELLFSQQRGDGWIPAVCPCPEDQRNKLTFPATDIFLIEMLRDYLFYSGDRETVRHYLPALLAALDAIERTADADGLVCTPGEAWNFYDWCFELRGIFFNGCRESMLNFLYAWGIHRFLELERLVEADSGRRTELLRRARRTAQASLEKFYHSEQGMIQDEALIYYENRREKVSSELAHAFAVLSGELPEVLQESFMQLTMDEAVPPPELYLHHILFRLWGETRHADEALRRIRRYWGRLAQDSFPTLAEAGVYMHRRNAEHESWSLCHGFSSAPAEFFQREILGIKPLTPGYTQFSFHPRLFDLEFAGGRVPTPQGNIEVELQRQSQGIMAELLVPPGCEALFPDGQEASAGRHCRLLPLSS